MKRMRSVLLICCVVAVLVAGIPHPSIAQAEPPESPLTNLKEIGVHVRPAYGDTHALGISEAWLKNRMEARLSGSGLEIKKDQPFKVPTLSAHVYAQRLSGPFEGYSLWFLEVCLKEMVTIPRLSIPWLAKTWCDFSPDYGIAPDEDVKDALASAVDSDLDLFLELLESAKSATK